MNAHYLANRIFNENVVYTEHEKSGISFFSFSAVEIDILCPLGWRLQKIAGGFLYSPPKVSLADLVDCSLIIQYGSYHINMLYFEFLKKMIYANELNLLINDLIIKDKENWKDFSYLISKGRGIEAEIVIYGSDNRVNQLKKLVYDYFFSTYFSYVDKKSDIKEISGNYNCNFSKILINSIQGLELCCFDIVIFIKNGCYKYIDAFYEVIDKNRTFFIDFHLTHEKFLSSVYKEQREIYLKKIVADKNVIVIDNAYSGRTLLSMKNVLTKTAANVTTFAIYPKSILAIDSIDFMLVTDLLIKRSHKPDSFFFKKCYSHLLKYDVDDNYFIS